MVSPPAPFRDAPNGHIATLVYPSGSTNEEETALLKALAEAFPAVVTIRVREALDAIGQIISNLALAIRGASALTLLAAVLVLGGALAAGPHQRGRGAVVLKAIGANRLGLLAA